MTLQIREATAEEHDAVGAVTVSAYAEFFAPGAIDEDESYLRHIGDVAGRADRTTILVAVEGGELLGSLTLELHGRVSDGDGHTLAPGEAHIRMLGVTPTARGRGVATALMDEAEARAVTAGKTHVTLNTTDLMTTAKALYGRRGYERMPDRVLDDGFVLLSYRKDLDRPARER